MTIDLTTVTEVDPNSRLSTTTTTSSFAGMANNESAYQYLDYGVGYFQKNFSLEGDFQLSAGAIVGRFCISFANSLGEWDSNAQELSVQFLIAADDTYLSIYPIERNAGPTYSGSARATTLAKFTRWYYRIFRTSALGGSKGGWVVQIYSDSARTTVVNTFAHTIALTDYNYQYFYPVQSYNYGNAATITGNHGNITVALNSAGADLTTGVETDTGTGRLVVYADCIVATALNIANSETAKHVAIDEGAGFFGDYTISGVLNIASFSSYTGAEKRFNILSVTDAAADALAANDLQGIAIQNNNSSVYTPYMHQAVGGTDTFSGGGPNLNFAQPYSFTLNRTGSTLTMKVWNDLVLTNFVGTSQVGSTVTWTGRATTTYRYWMPVASHLNGASSKSATFTLGGVRRTGGATTHTSTAALVSASSTMAGTGARSRIHAATAALVSGSSTLSATGVDTSTHTATAALVSGSSTLSAAGLHSFVGSHDGGAILLSSRGAILASGLRITGRAGTASLVSSSGSLSATGAIQRLPSLFVAKFDSLVGTPKIQVLRVSDSTTYDSSDSTYKASPTLANAQMTMTQVQATLWPTYYLKSLDTTSWEDGEYLTHCVDSGDSTNYRFDSYIYKNGALFYGGLLTDERAAVFTSAADSGVLTDDEHNQLMFGLPTETATAVLAAAAVTPIAADAKKMNGFAISGSGVSGDLWRG